MSVSLRALAEHALSPVFRAGVGRFVSHKYGYGVIDSARLVHEASLWRNVGPQVLYQSAVKVC